MRRWKIVVVVCFAVMALAFGCLLLYPEREQEKGEDAEITQTGMEASETVLEEERQEQLSEWLVGFAGIIYEYDTKERKFYVGAQDYMTKDAFSAFAPLDGEGGDAGPEEVRVQSHLLETKNYYYFTNDSHAEVIMESRFTLSAGGNGSLTQYLKLSIEKENGAWLITDCHVIDTMEQ